MILDAIMSILWFFLTVILSPFTLLSDVTPDSTVVSAISTATGYISALGVIIPMTAFRFVLIGTLAFEVPYGVYKIIRWVYRKIPGVT
jgi:hypothetical protein